MNWDKRLEEAARVRGERAAEQRVDEIESDVADVAPFLELERLGNRLRIGGRRLVRMLAESAGLRAAFGPRR